MRSIVTRSTFNEIMVPTLQYPNKLRRNKNGFSQLDLASHFLEDNQRTSPFTGPSFKICSAFLSYSPDPTQFANFLVPRRLDTSFLHNATYTKNNPLYSITNYPTSTPSPLIVFDPSLQSHPQQPHNL